MDINEKIHNELLKRVKRFSESYANNSNKIYKKINYNNSPITYSKNSLFQRFSLDNNLMFSDSNSKHKLYSIINLLKNDTKKYYREKIDSNNKHKRRFSPVLKRIKKINLNNNKSNTPKNNQCYHYKNNKLINDSDEENQIYKNIRYKTQDKKIKINLVNQKFKIADDFNEKNSKQFLKEKDECLKKMILTDEIEEEGFIPFCAENENESILSSINKNEYDDSIQFISELIRDLK